MWLEIYKNQSLYPFKKILKIEVLMLFEKFCHLYLLDKVLNESSCIFYFLIANTAQIYVGKFLILIYCPKISSTNQIVGFSIFQYSGSN